MLVGVGGLMAMVNISEAGTMGTLRWYGCTFSRRGSCYARLAIMLYLGHPVSPIHPCM